jgi:predicted phosphodiesterase
MAQKTTYTFVVRHESSYATEAPGVSPSDAILASNPYTLLIVGHSHTYEHRSQQEVLFGNGGAPLSGFSVNYGYGVFSQRQDGAIVVDAMDYQTNKPDSNFHFVVKPDGSATQ